MKALVIVLCGCAFLALPGIAHAETITGNVEWSTNHTVTSNLTIATGATLTVDGGVVVGLANGVTIDVQGALRTHSTTGPRALFRAFDPTVLSPHWGGIVAEAGSSLSLVDAIVQDTQQTTEAGIACYGCHLTLERSTIGQNPSATGPLAALRIYSTPGSLVNGVYSYGGVHVYDGTVTIQALTTAVPNGQLTLDAGSVGVMYSDIGGPAVLDSGRFAFGNDRIRGPVSLETGRASFLNTIVDGNVTTPQHRSAFPPVMTFGQTMAGKAIFWGESATTAPATNGIIAYDLTATAGAGLSSNTGFDTTGVAAYCQTSPCNIGPAQAPLQPGAATATTLAIDPPGGAVSVQQVTLTATVTPQGGDVAGGTVEFVDGSFLPGISCATSGCTVLASVPVGADGVAHATLTLPAGRHLLAAAFRGGTDPTSGDALLQSGSGRVDYTVTALSPPALTAPTDGQTVVGTSVPVAVTAVANATITFSVDGTAQTPVQADAAGAYTGLLTLPYGTHTLTATQTVSGATSAAAAGITVHVVPPAPTLTTPVDGATLHTTSVEVTGTGEPLAQIVVGFGGQLFSGSVDASGAFAVPVPAAYGTQTLSVTQSVNGASSAATTLTVDIVPAAPSLTEPTNGAVVVGPLVHVGGTAVAGATVAFALGGSSVGNVTADADGAFAADVALPYGTDSLTATQTIGGATSDATTPVAVHVAPAPPTVVTPADGSSATGPIHLTGTGVPGASLLVDDAGTTTTATVDATGNFDRELRVPPGAHVLSVTQVVAGERSAAVVVHATVLPDAPVLAAPADGAVFGTPNVAVSGTADAGVEVDVYDGTTKVGTATAAADGSFATSIALADGTHALTAVAVVGAMTSPASAAVHVVVDTAPPTSTATTNPAAAPWFRSTVHVAISATDAGSGVASVHWTTDGAENVASGASALVDITAEGATTLTYWAVDRAGNAEAPHQLVVRIDETAPVVACAAAPTGWSASEVSVACTASDDGSGLVDAASFQLTTSVGAGNETANASTGTRQVCDAAGNCSTAGPVSGLQVDREAPAISVTGGTYELGAPATATFSCSDGGSGVASCTAPPIDTSTPGPHTLTVTAVDNVGNRSTAAAAYVVQYSSAALCLGEPAHAVLPPFDASGTVTAKGNSTVPVKFRVCDAAGSSVGTPGLVVSVTGGSLAFRWDPTAQQWIANLSTKGLAAGARPYAIVLNDGTSIRFTVVVR